MKALNTQLILPSGSGRVPLEPGRTEHSQSRLWGSDPGVGRRRRSNTGQPCFSRPSRFHHLRHHRHIASASRHGLGTSTELGHITLHYGPPSMHRPGYSDEAPKSVNERAGDLCREAPSNQQTPAKYQMLPLYCSFIQGAHVVQEDCPFAAQIGRHVDQARSAARMSPT